MAFQDDAREEYARKLFKLQKDTSEGRSGIDAYLIVGKRKIPFELKSTSRGSVTTVRDFGPEHIKKWRGKHWLIGEYASNGKPKYFLYGSPKQMEPWIKEKEKYVMPDFQLADIAMNKLELHDLYAIIGKKDRYTLDDAMRLHKKQYSKKEYTRLMDLHNHYTPERMLSILKDRARYLIERGSTLNNPHIPESYFRGWEKITARHAARLREMVLRAISH